MKHVKIALILGLMMVSITTAVWAEDMMASAGQLTIYSATAFEQAGDAKRVLFFHASWCPSCIASEKAIRSLSLPADVKVFKVDYDSSAELKQRYGVVRQDTFVQVDQQGNKIKEWNGNARGLLSQLN